jgi:hypothetical protein
MSQHRIEDGGENGGDGDEHKPTQGKLPRRPRNRVHPPPRPYKPEALAQIKQRQQDEEKDNAKQNYTSLL